MSFTEIFKKLSNCNCVNIAFLCAFQERSAMVRDQADSPQENQADLIILISAAQFLIDISLELELKTIKLRFES